MKKENYTAISTELLKEKLRRANLNSGIFLGSMILIMLTIITLLILGETQGGFAGFVAILTPFTVYYSQKAAAIKTELCKRNKG
ncbi:MAG: hypothetical protein HEP71_13625 [Roseivirga sp.]|nr:hypothetical protein [Roseivirga sp.]